MINQYENLSYLSPFSGKTIPLKELCLSITDCPHSTPKWSEEGMIVIRNFNIKNGELDLSSPSYTDHGSYLGRNKRATPEPGDIIITREAPMGEVCMIPDGVECCLGQRMVLLKVDEQKVSNQYLLFALQSEFVQKQISKSDRTGSTVSNLCIPDLKEIEVPIFENSKAIADVLKAITSKIRVNNLINSELEAMAKTLYDYWFVQFDFPDANGKPYKASGGKMLYDSVLKQEIPAGWHVNTISDWIHSDKTGDWGKETKQGNYTLQVDCVRGADINGINGQGNVDAPNRFILRNNDHKLLAPFDFVIEISGGSPTQSTGRMAFITEHVLERFNYPLICSNFCKAIDLIDKRYFYNFAYQWQSLYENGVFFGWEGKTSGIKNLLFDSFVSNYNVVMPPKDLAEKFFQFVSPLQEQRQKKLKENAELEGLRDWLLPMLMNGQVTVKSSTEPQGAQHG